MMIMGGGAGSNSGFGGEITASELFEQQFEIMNPNARGVDRLFNEEDRVKFTTIKSALEEFLEDITAEENDMHNGYISSINS